MRENDSSEEGSSHLFVVRYDDDAERKRVEYLFNNWTNGSIEKPAGLVRIATDVDHDELYEDLISKVPPDQVDSYVMEPAEPDVTAETTTVTQSINAPPDAVEPFIEYILSKKKAVLQSAARNEYEVYTKKGRAEITYQLSGQDGMTEATIRVSGYPPAPGFLAEFFRTELTDYATTQA